MRRGTGLLASAAISIASLAFLPAPNAEAGVPTKGSFTLSANVVQLRDVVSAKGWLPPQASRTVFLQQKVSWGWAPVDKSKTSAKGTFKFTYVAPTSPGTVVFRVVAPRRVIKRKIYPMIQTPRQRLTIQSPLPPEPGDTTRITEGSNRSDRATLSADGHFIVFDSLAPNLVTGDTNDYQDVFVRDRTTGVTTRITNGRGTSYAGAISADGRFVAFDSYASSLVPGDTNQSRDVFVYDQQTDTTTRITDGNDGSYVAGISADGRFVVLHSYADNLVPNDVNGYRDVFLYDRDTQTTNKITAGNGASLAPAISADGAWISFYSGASNLVPGDRNRARDVFLYNRETGVTTRVTDGNGASYSSGAALSGDGRYFTFYSLASDLVSGDTNERTDVFLYDRVVGGLKRITNGNNHSGDPAFSAGGQRLVFDSFASNLSPGDGNGQADVFLYDLAEGSIKRLTGGAGASYNASVSGDGTLVAFTSVAADLTIGGPPDTNNMDDIFVWKRLPETA
jgi:Tol biopolymer transport system component